jgi:5'-nucleotidase/UDP-sugar diphosphatase
VKTRHRILLLFLFLTLLCITARAGKKIVILYTNDMMGRLRGEPAYFINKDFPPPLGNAGSCATYVREAREEAEKKGFPVLLLDGGNCFGNAVLGDLEIGKTLAFMNTLGYDASAVGIYDSRLRKDVLWDIIDKSTFPWLSSNLRYREDHSYVTQRYLVIDCDGITVGLFGLISEYGPIWVEKEVYGDFIFEKEGPRAEEMVDYLRERGCDIVVGLTNIGFVHDSILADSVDGIDIIIGGGEGRGLQVPFESVYNHTIICRTYGNLSSIGRLEIEIDEDIKKVIGYTGENVTLFEEQFPPDREILELLEK